MGRVFLRALDMADLDRCFRWISDPEVNQFILSGRFPINREREAEWIAGLYKSTTDLIFGICKSDDGTHIGNCGVHGMDLVDRNGTLGITLGEKSVWGQGLGTEAAALLLDRAFDGVGLNRVELEVYSFNARAIKSYQKLGFRQEGCMKERRYKNGAYRDVVWMGILREEWAAHRPSLRF